MRKHELDLDVALETGVSQKKVRLITQVFLHKAAQALIEGHEVMFDGFGRLKLVEQGGAPPPHARFGSRDKSPEETGVRLRVHFKKSLPFAKAVKQHIKENAHGEVRRRRVR